jgi:phospholipid/cholesterol/gamma-HCH transport system permease protein
MIAAFTTVVSFVGASAIALLESLGAALRLLAQSLRWVALSIFTRSVRFGRAAFVSQVVRIGVRSVGIVVLVSGCVGLILAFQIAPPLDERGGKEFVPNIIGVAVLRELGPLIGAIVLTGFAGASIAAEIGTMVVSEEIEALEAHALNPVRYLVVPRVCASVVSMGVLAVLADLAALTAAMGVSVVALDIPYAVFMENLLSQVKPVDFYTGLGKALVFGLLIGLIACYNGLKVSGGAAGVGRATTSTVVQSVVSIIIADLVFTAIFYAQKLV